MSQNQKIAQYLWYSNNIIIKLFLLLLIPLSVIYYFLFNLKKIISNEKSFQPEIICVGNCSVGGDGKTSTMLSLINIYQSKNKKIAVLLKGYKGKIKLPTQVDDNDHSAIDVGDEALLYVKQAKTFISDNRLAGINFIINNHSLDAILIDDGLQDFRIKKDKNILVINGNRGFGNGFLLPAGPLRQSPSSAIRIANIIIIIGEDKNKIYDLYKPSNNEKLFLQAEIKCEKENSNKNYFAFSGIGNNDGFINTLNKNNYNVKKIRLFPDHYYYSKNDIENIKKEASEDNLRIITTEKDWKRLNLEQQEEITFLPISVEFSDLDTLNNALFPDD
jgi:tetraacyldisaccharide 4'-kinase